MRLGWRELIRRPGRFLTAGAALSLLAVLLLLLGGLLDGLFLGSTGAIRAQDADVFVYSIEARQSFIRSRIEPDLRDLVDGIDEVDTVGGLSVSLLGAAVPGEEELSDVALIGYEQPGSSGLPGPPDPGEGWADERLRSGGVDIGDVLRLGPAEVPVEVIGFVDDTSYLLQGGLWVNEETWREVQESARPDVTLGPGVSQVLIVSGDDDLTPDELATLIDTTTGTTETLTMDEAVFSLPGTSQQNSTFNALIAVTLFVAGLVVVLFFALIVIERSRQYATLKALGVPSSRLLLVLVSQSVLVAAGAFVIGGLITYGLSVAIPEDVPVQLRASRALLGGALLMATAVLGSLLSLRRINRIDPAQAIS